MTGLAERSSVIACFAQPAAWTACCTDRRRLGSASSAGVRSPQLLVVADHAPSSPGDSARPGRRLRQVAPRSSPCRSHPLRRPRRRHRRHLLPLRRPPDSRPEDPGDQHAEDGRQRARPVDAMVGSSPRSLLTRIVNALFQVDQQRLAPRPRQARPTVPAGPRAATRYANRRRPCRPGSWATIRSEGVASIASRPARKTRTLHAPRRSLAASCPSGLGHLLLPFRRTRLGLGGVVPVRRTLDVRDYCRSVRRVTDARTSAEGDDAMPVRCCATWPSCCPATMSAS